MKIFSLHLKYKSSKFHTSPHFLYATLHPANIFLSLQITFSVDRTATGIKLILFLCGENRIKLLMLRNFFLPCATVFVRNEKM